MALMTSQRSSPDEVKWSPGYYADCAMLAKNLPGDRARLILRRLKRKIKRLQRRQKILNF